MVLLLLAGKLYEADICTILLLLRRPFEWCFFFDIQFFSFFHVCVCLQELYRANRDLRDSELALKDRQKELKREVEDRGRQRRQANLVKTQLTQGR